MGQPGVRETGSRESGDGLYSKPGRGFLEGIRGFLKASFGDIRGIEVVGFGGVAVYCSVLQVNKKTFFKINHI